MAEWQTHQLEVLAVAILCGFKSHPSHQRKEMFLLGHLFFLFSGPVILIRKGLSIIMKSFSAVLAAMLAASLLLTGCSSSQNESSAPENNSSSVSSSEPDSSAEIPNPVQPVKTAAELAEMGFDIVLPAEAEEIEYSVIDGTIAQAVFTLSDSEWTLRTGDSEEDISGLNGERTQLSSVSATAHDGTAVTVQIESVDTGEETPRLCAVWELNGMRYTLTTLTEDETAFQEMCSNIVGNLGGETAAEADSSDADEPDSSASDADSTSADSAE